MEGENKKSSEYLFFSGCVEGESSLIFFSDYVGVCPVWYTEFILV